MLSQLAAVDWNELLNKPDMLPLLIVTVFAGIIVLVAIIAPQWRKAKQAGDEARLKERMIERGFTADEIETVIKASATPKPGGRLARLRRSGSDDSAPQRFSSETSGV